MQTANLLAVVYFRESDLRIWKNNKSVWFQIFVTTSQMFVGEDIALL